MLRAPRKISSIAFAVLALTVGAASAYAGTGGVSPNPQPQPQPAPSGDSGTLHFVASIASWYGPGLYGNRTACGQRLTRETLGVANRKLPCGTNVVFRFRNTIVRTTVIDRGPYANGASWDLTRATADALGFTETGVGRVQVAKVATQP